VDRTLQAVEEAFAELKKSQSVRPR
jgi:hypothetical protein